MTDRPWYKRFDEWCERRLGPCYPCASWQVWLPVLFVSVVAVIVSAVLVFAPRAGASPPGDATSQELTFLHDVQSIGIGVTGNEQYTIDDGWTICGLLNSGESPLHVAYRLYKASETNYGTSGMTTQQAQGEVAFAIKDLCSTLK